MFLDRGATQWAWTALCNTLFQKEQGGHTFSPEAHGEATACCPNPGVRVPDGTHQTFQSMAIVARTCRACRPPFLHVTGLRVMCVECRATTSVLLQRSARAWCPISSPTKRIGAWSSLFNHHLHLQRHQNSFADPKRMFMVVNWILCRTCVSIADLTAAGACHPRCLSA